MLTFLYNFLVEQLGVNMTYEIKDFIRNSPVPRKALKQESKDDIDSVLRKRVRHRKYTI